MVSICSASSSSPSFIVVSEIGGVDRGLRSMLVKKGTRCVHLVVIDGRCPSGEPRWG